MEVKQHSGTHEMYQRILKPAYERMVIQHVFKNKINLKSGATSQLLQKRPKTTGYLSRKKHFSELRRATSPHSTTYWRPGTYDQWRWNSKAGSTVVSVKMMQDGNSAVYPRLTDDRNLKASSLSNTFSATTRVREVPVTGIYRKEIQDLHCRSPSARGVRSIPLTNRSLIVPPQSVKSSYMALHSTDDFDGRLKGSQQAMRHILELERMEKTREMKRHAQISGHRMDRMYYMNGAPVRLHNRYSITDMDLERLQQIAVSQGIKLSTSASSYQSKSNGKTISAPNSSPRDLRRSSDAGSGSKTIIPTADTISVGGDYISDDGTSEKATDQSGKEDAATSDHGNDVEDAHKLESGLIESNEQVDSQNSEKNDDEIEKETDNNTENALNMDDGVDAESETEMLSPETVNAPLAVSGAFLTDITDGD